MADLNLTRGLNSAFTDRGVLSYGAGRLFGGAALEAIIPSPLDLTDMSWLPGITSPRHDSDFGRTQGITMQRQVGMIDLTTADDGERPADRGKTHFTWRVQTSLADAGIERLVEAFSGLELEYDDSGNILRMVGTDRTYELDSSILIPLLFRAYRSGVLSTNPMDNLLFFSAAASTEDGSLAFTANEQRVFPVDFLIYKSLDNVFEDPDTGDDVPLHWTSFSYEAESESSSS